MKKIIYTRPDGGMSVVHPVRNTFPIPETTMTDAEIEQRAWDRLPKDAGNPQWVAADAIPADRTFRNAWTQADKAINVDPDKAKVIREKRLASEAEVTRRK